MNIQIKLGEGAKLPVNAHESDTGYDVIAVSDPKIVGETMLMPNSWCSIDYIEYDTQISVAPESASFGYAGIRKGEPSARDLFERYGQLDVRPRSSISKYNLALANPPATIDHSYRGTIKLRFKYLWQPMDFHGNTVGPIYGIINMDKIYRKGDKIAQLIAAWKEPINWIQVDELPETMRADGGFGSSGT